MLGKAMEELTIVNPRKKRGRKKTTRKRTTKRRSPRRAAKRRTTRRRTRRNPAPKRRRRRTAARTYTRRRSNPQVKLNPIGRDIVEDIKNALLVTGGVIGGIAASAYASEKIDIVAENEWAPGAIMIGAGIGLSSFLTGKNRKLGTLLGLGSMTAGLMAILRPYIAGKVPGFPEVPPMEAVIAPSPEITAGYLPAGRTLEGYLPDLPTMGQADPFAYPGYAMGGY